MSVHPDDYQELKLLGLCVHHPYRDAAPGRVVCQDCLEKAREHYRRRYKAWASKKDPRCRRCRVPLPKGYLSRACPDCLEKDSARKRKEYHKP